MAKVAGSLWVEGDNLHYVDQFNREWYMPGIYVKATSAQPGSMWFETSNQYLYYVNEAGNGIFYPYPVGDNSIPLAANMGSLWIGQDNQVHWAGVPINASVRYNVRAHNDIAPTSGHTDAHQDSVHTDIAHTNVAHTDVHSDYVHSDWHNDVPHSDSHTNVHEDHHQDEHGDIPHGDAGNHEDFPMQHINHQDGFHQDGFYHGDYYPPEGHTDSHHGDSHGDQHYDSHQDVPHQNIGHSDSHSNFWDGVAHQDVPHSDVPHSNVAHNDAHQDAHVDTPHTDHPILIGA